MNLLILSPGRRVEIVQYFKSILKQDCKRIICLDMSETAPALYFADKYYVIEKDYNNLTKYINQIIDIAINEDVGYIMTMIDPELELLAKKRILFQNKKIGLILSGDIIIENTYDKFLFYQYFKGDISLVKTFENIRETLDALNKNVISFPLIAKHRKGSASIGVQKINNNNELEKCGLDENYIFQEFIEGKEYGVDAYFDMISGEIVSVFMKEKISMRAGETDKSISVFRPDIWKEIKKFEKYNGFKGPIDFDVFINNSGELFINEINPRLGGGYPHAYNCGINFMKLVLNNMNGHVNNTIIGGYPVNILMMKYNGHLFKKGNEILKDNLLCD